MDRDTTDTHSGWLPLLGLLRFTGADTAAFLQGQVSNDTGRLAGGQALLCALSSAQGRVQAVMTLLPHSTGLLAILPRALLAPTAARLRRFILRSKVRIEESPEDLLLCGVFGSAHLRAAGLPLPQEVGAYTESQGAGIARLRDPQPRYWLVGPAAKPAAFGLVDPGDAGAAWRLADIRAGLPQVYAETSEEFVAQMLNLDLVDGVSFAKGCYTGQEIIARTQHLGRIKRRMFRVSLDGVAPGPPAIGAAVRLADGRSGRVTECAPTAGRYEALAVLPLEAAVADGGPGLAASLLSLPYAFG